MAEALAGCEGAAPFSRARRPRRVWSAIQGADALRWLSIDATYCVVARTRSCPPAVDRSLQGQSAVFLTGHFQGAHLEKMSPEIGFGEPYRSNRRMVTSVAVKAESSSFGAGFPAALPACGASSTFAASGGFLESLMLEYLWFETDQLLENKGGKSWISAEIRHLIDRDPWHGPRLGRTLYPSSPDRDSPRYDDFAKRPCYSR